MELETKQALLSYLEGFITEHKRSLFDQLIKNRTRHITVVLEDIYQSQNASAVLRSCDCYGIQDVHIIENKNIYSIDPDVALGSSKWLNLIKYNQGEENTLACFNALREAGYRIVATTPHKEDKLLDELDLSSKVALVFGTELEGLSGTAIEDADEYVKIPMYGFTESFNISVSAAIILHHLTEKMRRSGMGNKLTEEEMLDIRLMWARNVIRQPELYENKFLKQKGLI
ncbi:MAG: RNA methyltransferase [Bacteroidetes bacterium]|nr:RNA methyltransferase [Bacteroidota bacterium]